MYICLFTIFNTSIKTLTRLIISKIDNKIYFYIIDNNVLKVYKSKRRQNYLNLQKQGGRMNLLFVLEIIIILLSGIVYFVTLLSKYSTPVAISVMAIFTIITTTITFFVTRKRVTQNKLCFVTTTLAVIIACLNPILCFPISLLFTAILISIVDKTLMDIEFFSLLGVNTVIYLIIAQGPRLLEKVMSLF